MKPPVVSRRRMGFAPVAALSALLGLTACNTPTNSVGEKLLTEIQATVTEIKTNVTAVKESQKKVETAQSEFDKKQAETLQMAADSVDGASYVALHSDPANAYTALVADELKVAGRVLPKPSANNQERIIKDLKAALSKDQVQIADLKRRQEEAQARADKAVADLGQANINLGAAKAEAKTQGEKLDQTVEKLSGAEHAAAMAKAAADDAEAKKRAAENAKARLHIAYAFMAGGGLLIVATIVATALHVPGILAAGLSAGGGLVALGWIMTILNEWLQNVWFRVGIGVILLAAIGVGVLLAIRAFKTRKQADEDAKIGTAAIGALQEARNDDAKLGRNTFAKIEPYLKEWFVDDDGHPDTALQKALKARLVKMNLINPEGADDHVVPDLQAAAVAAADGATRTNGHTPTVPTR